MAVARINTETAMQCVGSITESMRKITDECTKHSTVLTDLAAQTNIKPIVTLDTAFQQMSLACKQAAESSQETLEKTRKYCEEVDEIDSDEGNLFSE